MKELIISTADKNLETDIQSVAIAGIVTNKKIRFVRAGAILTTDTSNINNAVDIIVKYSGDVAVALFASWLYDRLKNKETKQTKINGIEVSGEGNDVHVQINTYINCQHCSSKPDEKE